MTPGALLFRMRCDRRSRELHHRCGGALALVSGRLIRDIRSSVRAAPAPRHRRARRGNETVELPTQTRPSGRNPRQHSQHWSRPPAAIDPRIIMEDKGTSLAVHYRLAPLAEPALKAKFAAMFRTSCRTGSRGYVRQGRHRNQIEPLQQGYGGPRVDEKSPIFRDASRYSSATTRRTCRCSRYFRRWVAQVFRSRRRCPERTAFSVRLMRCAAGLPVFAA